MIDWKVVQLIKWLPCKNEDWGLRRDHEKKPGVLVCACDADLSIRRILEPQANERLCLTNKSKTKYRERCTWKREQRQKQRLSSKTGTVSIGWRLALEAGLPPPLSQSQTRSAHTCAWAHIYAFS